MKLTKNDFVLEYPFEDECNETFPREDVIEQILKNQEDAEKWNQTLEDTTPHEVYERLKKRIEEIKRTELDEKYSWALMELQKILKGEEYTIIENPKWKTGCENT